VIDTGSVSLVHVVAESFHKFFGEVAAVVFEHVDTLDERITQLGEQSDATVEQVARAPRHSDELASNRAMPGFPLA
jgi:DNA-binding ferritin-like protein